MMVLCAALATNPVSAGDVVADKSAVGPDAPIAAASLVADTSAIAAGTPFTLAVRLALPPGWHTYWINPGETGAPTHVEWQLPDGFAAAPLDWPMPERLASGSTVSYGYHGDVWLTSRVVPPANLVAGTTAEISASVDWLVCADICVPEQATLSLSLPVAEIPQPAPVTITRQFAAAAVLMPRPAPASLTVTAGSDGLVLALDGASEPGGPVSNATFFPAVFGLIEDAAPQTFERTTGGIRLTLPRPATGAPPSTEIKGLLVLDSSQGRIGYTVLTPLRS